MDLSELLDNYCERQSDAFFSEPLNLISNAAFLFAAYLAFRNVENASAKNRASIVWLCAMLALVGVGSSLFHSFATRWAMLSDTIPIQIFILSFFWFWQRSVYHFNRLLSVGGVSCLFFGTAALASYTASLPLNGSQSYLGTLLALLAIGVLYLRAQSSYRMLVAACVFFVSIVARSVDESICHAIPVGTHFLWHLLNAYVCYTVIDCYAAACSSERDD